MIIKPFNKDKSCRATCSVKNINQTEAENKEGQGQSELPVRVHYGLCSIMYPATHPLP